VEALSRQWLILEGLKQRRVPEKERHWNLNLAWEFLAREEGRGEETRRDERGWETETRKEVFSLNE
jgi:hypothetical protein